MLAGVDVEAAFSAMGRRGLARTRDVVRGLRALKVPCADALVPLRRAQGFTPAGIARMASSDKRRGHWVVWLGDGYLDPADGQFYEAEDFARDVAAAGWRLVSLLPVGVSV